jgi:hypothetical protein
MIWDFLKSKQFNYIFSFLLGLGLISILRPACKGDECVITKAPLMHEIEGKTFQLGHKCYQFTIQNVDCPAKGVVEAFQISRA